MPTCYNARSLFNNNNIPNYCSNSNSNSSIRAKVVLGVQMLRCLVTWDNKANQWVGCKAKLDRVLTLTLGSSNNLRRMGFLYRVGLGQQVEMLEVQVLEV